MATATGVVKKIKGNIAEILINRGTRCGDNCAHCGICGDNKTTVRAVNNIGAQAGERVEVSVVTGFSLAAAALVYGVPIIILFAGLMLMTALELSAGVGLCGTAAAMVIWFVIMSIFDKKGKFKKYSATVTRRLT